MKAFEKYDNMELGAPKLSYYTEVDGTVKAIIGYYNGNGTYTISDAVDLTSLDASVAELEKGIKVLDTSVQALDTSIKDLEAKKANTRDLVWTKEETDNIKGDVVNKNGQVVATISEDGELKLWVEGEYMVVNDLLAQLAHETYDFDITDLSDVTSGVIDASTKDELIYGTFSSANVLNKVVAKSIKANKVTADSNIITMTSESGNIELQQFANIGTTPLKANGGSNAQLSLNTIGNTSDIVIDGATFNQATNTDNAGKNGIEIGLNAASAPKNITIKNVNFNGSLGNNDILIFNTADDAVVNIENVNFGTCSNPIRFSNRDGHKVTVNIKNCTCDQWDKNAAWACMIIFEDYTSADTTACQTNNLFGPDKMTINIDTFTYQGKVLTNPAQISDVIPSSTTPDGTQWFYIWNNNETGGYVPYSSLRYSTFTIK